MDEVKNDFDESDNKKDWSFRREQLREELKKEFEEIFNDDP